MSNFITKNELKQLAEMKSETHPTVSLYLNITSPRKYITELKSLINQQKEKLSKKNFDSFI